MSSASTAHSYAIAIGSNRSHGRHGLPRSVVAGVIQTLVEKGLRVLATSQVIDSPPIGPSRRRYANAAIVIATPLDPVKLLQLLQKTEREFGRRKAQRWGARVIDLDIILWSRGAWRTRWLEIPHPDYSGRDFVLNPLLTIAPDWRDPETRLTVRQQAARLNKRRPAIGCGLAVSSLLPSRFTADQIT